MKQDRRRAAAHAAALAAGAAFAVLPTKTAHADPTISRLTPPSRLFSEKSAAGPITARFLPDQRFDLQATVQPDAGRTITKVEFFVDGASAGAATSMLPADANGVKPGSVSALRRAYASTRPGVRTLRVDATQSDGKTVSATGNFEVVGITRGGRRAKNVIFCIGDGFGIAHRTAARVMARGVLQGKASAPLAMDTFPATAFVMTPSLNSIVTDSSPGAHCYSTGNKADNNEEGVFPDDTTDFFDNPRIENVGEYLHRKERKALGIVTTADVFDATPGSFGAHTSNRGAGTGIVDMFFAEREKNGLQVLMGGGRKWFLPSGTPGSQRNDRNDYVLPPDAAQAWGIPAGEKNGSRDVLAEDWEKAGWTYAPDRKSLDAVPASATRLIGLFALSNMNVAKDKIDGRRGAGTVVRDYGFPDQPMLDEMAGKALDVLKKNRDGFFLMLEGASIDKQSHAMDPERLLLDVIEFDRAIAVCKKFAEENPDTLIVVTADHECAGVNIIGASKVTNEELRKRAAAGGGAGELRDGVVGTYEDAGFPRYTIAPDGYPVSTDIDRKMLLGFAANADRHEDWLTNPLPLPDASASLTPLTGYPANVTARDAAGAFRITGHISGGSAAHTGSDVPLSAFGRGAASFAGVLDNTEVFFRTMQAVLGGERR